MPRVPTLDAPQVGATVAPMVGFQSPSGPNAQQIGGQQMQQLGAAGERAGDAASRIALDMQEQVNQVRVNDAVNKARMAAQRLAYDPDTGYLNLKGDAALTRPDGQALPDEYGSKLQTQMSEIAGTLGNEAQRRQFALNANDLATQFHGQVETHMLSEFRSHALSVQDGTINLAADDAARNWNNPDLMIPSINAAKAAVVEKGRISGWSASQTDAALLTTTSKVHTDIIMSALANGNPTYAQEYLAARRGEMTADDILRAHGHVDQAAWMNQAQTAVQAATVKAMPQIAPTNFDRMAQITASTESGNKDFNADGTPVVSPKGAIGRMQVMPATAANPGLGLKPLPADATPDQRAQFGRDYLQALVQRYGDPAKAWAAYNAGFGAVDKAIADAKQELDTGAFRGGQPDPTSYWLTKLPKETQAYVATNVKALQGSGGIAPRPTEFDFVNSAVAALPPGAPPQAVKLAREQAVQQFSIINRSMNEQGTATVSDAQRWLAANNGNYSQMPPSLQDAVTRYAPDKADDLIRYAKAFERGENQTDLRLYNRLAAHPEEMTAMSDTQFEMLRAKLSIADFKHFANERANYLNARADESAEAINSKALNQSLNTRLESLQINTAPAPKDLENRERLGGIQQFVRNSIFDAQQQAGKKFTPAEIDEHVDGLFAHNVTFRRTFMGIPTTPTDPQNLMALRPTDIPADTKDQLRAAFARRGRPNPTDSELINAYRAWKIGQSK